MKLKLETQDATTVLIVTGPVTADNIPVLKAGLLKFAQTGKTQVILDLTAVREREIESPAAIIELDLMSQWAAEHDFDLLVASLVQDLGDVPSAAHALAIYDSPAADLLIQECILKAEVRRLKSRKANLENKLESLKGEAVKIRQLKKDNSHLEKTIDGLERQIFKLLEKRAEPPLPPSAKTAELEKTLQPLLYQLGIVRTRNA